MPAGLTRCKPRQTGRCGATTSRGSGLHAGLQRGVRRYDRRQHAAAPTRHALPAASTCRGPALCPPATDPHASGCTYIDPAPAAAARRWRREGKTNRAPIRCPSNRPVPIQAPGRERRLFALQDRSSERRRCISVRGGNSWGGRGKMKRNWVADAPVRAGIAQIGVGNNRRTPVPLPALAGSPQRSGAGIFNSPIHAENAALKTAFAGKALALRGVS